MVLVSMTLELLLYLVSNNNSEDSFAIKYCNASLSLDLKPLCFSKNSIIPILNFLNEMYKKCRPRILFCIV